MNILIVAYACEPGKGSEPGIGWAWTTGLARNSLLNITVLTRSNNRAAIEAALPELAADASLEFEFWDLPPWLSWWKRGQFAIYPYYILWCFGLRWKLREIVRARGIDVLHHLTFSTDWLPGCLPRRAPCATVVGPLGGYDTSAELSRHVRGEYLKIDRWKKRIRAAGLYLRRNELSRYDCVIANNLGFGDCYKNFVRPEALEYISTQVSDPDCIEKPPVAGNSGEGKLIVIAGRIIYWKGFDAALAALATYRDRGAQFRAIIVGTGDQDYLNSLHDGVENLSLAPFLDFRPQMDRTAFLSLLDSADIFLYPTFYGTADSIMMEAAERKIPIVCFPSHGAKELLGDSYPHMASGFTVGDLADKLEAADKWSLQNLAASEAVARNHAPERKLAAVADIYGKVLNRFWARQGDRRTMP